MLSDALYLDDRRLPRIRATSTELEPQDVVRLGWVEFLHGKPERARQTFQRARQQGPTWAKDYAALNAYILDDLLRGRVDRDQGLRRFWRRARADGPPEVAQLAMAHYLYSLAEQGCPAPVIGDRLADLAELATKTKTWLGPVLKLRVARNLFDRGQLLGAIAACDEVLKGHRVRAESRARAVILRRILETLTAGRGLEGLPFGSLSFLARLEYTLLAAEVELRVGRVEAARCRATEAARLATRHRIPGAQAAVARVTAAICLENGQYAAVRDHLKQACILDESIPATAKADVLAAQLEVAEGHYDVARASLNRLLPTLEVRGYARPLHDALLLELRLDLLQGGAVPLGDLRQRWNRAKSWEDPVDRWRFLLTVLPVVRSRRDFIPLVRGLLQTGRVGDPRRRAIQALWSATTDRLAGRPEAAQRRLAKLEDPPTWDLPTRVLRRWRSAITGTPYNGTDALAREEAARLAALFAAPQASLSSEADLIVNLVTRQVTVRGKPQNFQRRAQSLQILRLLLTNPEGVSLTRLTEVIWERSRIPYETDRLVHTAIFRLRQHLGDTTLVQVREGQDRENRYLIAPDTTIRLVEG